jgi:hypothetical protein
MPDCKRIDTQKKLSLWLKVFVFLAVALLAFAILKTTISTTAQSSQSKRQLDDRVPRHLPIKIKIKKEKELDFQDLKNEHWARDFQLEVKNTGERPIYALSLVWMLTDVKMPDGNPYGSTFKYGRSEFITVPGERPKPDDVPIKPGETYVFKLSNSTVEGWESWAKDNHLPQPKNVQIIFNFICFGDDTGWESPDGQPFKRQKPLASYSPIERPPNSCEQQSRRESSLPFGFSIVPASFAPANFFFRKF